MHNAHVCKRLTYSHKVKCNNQESNHSVLVLKSITDTVNAKETIISCHQPS